MSDQTLSIIYFAVFIIVCAALIFGIAKGLMKRSKK